MLFEGEGSRCHAVNPRKNKPVSIRNCWAGLLQGCCLVMRLMLWSSALKGAARTTTFVIGRCVSPSDFGDVYSCERQIFLRCDDFLVATDHLRPLIFVYRLILSQVVVRLSIIPIHRGGVTTCKLDRMIPLLLLYHPTLPAPAMTSLDLF